MRGGRSFLPRPRWVQDLDVWVGKTVRVHPLALSSLKLLVVTPLLVLALSPAPVIPNDRRLVTLLLVVFFGLDFLEASVARARDGDPPWVRVFDRFSDYPLLLAVVVLAVDSVSPLALWLKVGLDLGLLVLFMFGRGRTQNRLRTGISYATLIGLMWVGQGWTGRVLTEQAVEYLLWANVAFLGTSAAFYLGLLQKRFVADALSGANLLCGIFSMVFASRGRFEISLLFVILGTAFDGFDGAAARRWGGTKMGVYSDDVADGVNYGIAPGVALYFVLGGVSGWLVGIFYASFTIVRLVFFTLNKADSDPNYFSGVPSPVGGLITMSSIVVFQDEPGALGLMVGVAAAQMVSFSTHYRHLGRAIAQHRRAVLGAPLYLLVLLLGLRVWGPKGGAAVILVGNVAYGFLPTVLAFARVVSVHRARRRGELPSGDEVDDSPPPESEPAPTPVPSEPVPEAVLEAPP